jgi:hypothetical protein
MDDDRLGGADYRKHLDLLSTNGTSFSILSSVRFQVRNHKSRRWHVACSSGFEK